MLKHVVISYFSLTIYGCICAAIRKSDRTVFCTDLSEDSLSQILGPAYNSRYMSIDRPVEDDFEVDANYKRKASAVPSFYVDDNYAMEIADEPAWTVNHVRLAGSVADDRRKRSAKGQKQWECEAKITWTDLGADYFPRYLRSVACTSKSCWYGHYNCRPRSFTVKVLRRKRGRCSVVRADVRVGIDGLPVELRQLWVWEEHAVNFCCDCSL